SMSNTRRRSSLLATTLPGPVASDGQVAGGHAQAQPGTTGAQGTGDLSTQADVALFESTEARVEIADGDAPGDGDVGRLGDGHRRLAGSDGDDVVATFEIERGFEVACHQREIDTF